MLLGASAAAPHQAGPSRTTQPFTVVAQDGRHALPATQVGDQWMVTLEDLATLFELIVREDTVTGGVSVSYRNKSVALTPGQPIASAGGRLVSLSAPLVRSGQTWLVPVDFISRALALIYDTRLEVRRNSRLVLQGEVQVPRVVVREEPVGSQVRLTFDIAPRTPHLVVQEPNRLLVRFESDLLDASLPTFPAQGLLQAVRLADPNTTIALDLGPRFGGYRASVVPQEGNASQLVIDLIAADQAPAAPRAAPAVPSADVPAFGALPSTGLRAIVIDPGHGGDEVGAKGSTGKAEKDITLALARRLKAVVEARLGIRVLLTRDTDRIVPLDERAALANNSKADLFVSLHANASARKDTSGAQIFYLGADLAGDDARRAAATPASLPALGGGVREVDMILWEMAQIRHLSDSAVLAGVLEEQFRNRVRLNARPVQQAPFRVLAGANMPAVLVEVGFLTNPDEELQLASDTYQGTIVQALFDGLVRFRESLERSRQQPSPPVPAAAAGDRR